MSPKRPKKIGFTRHAREKFQLLRKYGFEVSDTLVREVVMNPIRVDRKDDLVLALKPVDREYAIRVVYRMVNDNIVVVIFYPVKRERFNV